MSDLGTLGGTFSRAMGINNAGEIVGYSKLADGSEQPFLYRNGVMEDIGNVIGAPPGGRALDINIHGDIVGTTNGFHAFLYRNGLMTNL